VVSLERVGETMTHDDSAVRLALKAPYVVSRNHCGYFVSERLYRWRSRFKLPTWVGSSYYQYRDDAEALRAWLAERYNQYPVNLLLAEAP
jgi:hypothetical protein